MSVLHLGPATAIFVVGCCQYGPSWIFGLNMELMACAIFVGGTTEQSCLFPYLICSYQWYQTILNFLHYTSAVPQPFLLLIAANLALAGFLGWTWSLWPVPALLAVQQSKTDWLAIQRSKAVFLLTLYDSINDIKYFRNCMHYTSAVPQPFLLLIAANLAQAGF